MTDKLTGDKEKPEAQIEFEMLVQQMRQQAEVTTGVCSVCSKEAVLLSGVCEQCFTPWC